MDIRKILEGSGFKVESIDRIKLARGVVGKVSYVAGAALLVLGALALRVDSAALFGIIAVAAVLLFLAYLVGILWFATKNPGLALLEGAELIQWRQMDMGLKGAESIPDMTNIEAPPQLEGPTKQ